MTRICLVAFTALLGSTFACQKPATSSGDTSATASTASAASTAPASPASAAATAAAVSAPTQAPTSGYRWEVHVPTQMAFEVPTDWTRKILDGNVLLIASPTPGAAVEFVAATGGLTATADENAILGAIGRDFQNAKLTGPVKPATQHGLNGWVATGTGQKNGNTIEFLTSGVGDGRGHEILATAFYSPTASQTIKQQLVHVLDSIQSANP